MSRNSEIRRQARELAGPIGSIAVLFGLALFYGEPPRPREATGTRPREHVRLAYFPNLTHAPALAGLAMGKFRRALPEGVGLSPKPFNAGPEAMEALLAGEIDLAFVGPSPAVNTFIKSNGRALRVVAGACSGGSGLVASEKSGIRSITDLAGKRVAIPQLGGTQDVSLRHFLAREGLQPREKGGQVDILPAKNPDILPLFTRGELDAAWVPEPWLTRLLIEAKGKLVVDERTLWPDGRYCTTVVAVRTGYLRDRPHVVDALLRAHVGTIAWLRANPEQGQTVVNAELKQLTGKELPGAVIRAAWSRMEFTSDPLPASIRTLVRAAADCGYLPSNHLELAGLFEGGPLQRAQGRSMARGPATATGR